MGVWAVLVVFSDTTRGSEVGDWGVVLLVLPPHAVPVLQYNTGTSPKMHYNKSGVTPCPTKVAIRSFSAAGAGESELIQFTAYSGRWQISDMLCSFYFGK